VERLEPDAKIALFERRAARERDARKHAEALLEEKSRALYLANLAAQQAADAKSRFLANVSHELRTPMNGVLGALHLLRTTDDPAARARLMDEAVSAGMRLADLLGDIVAFSDLETNSVVIRREPSDVGQVLEAAVGPHRDQASSKGLWLRIEAGPDPGKLALDAERLRQLLFSLVANAVKFTSSGGVDVRAIVRGCGEATRLRIEVQDTGVGVPPEAKDRLFSEFVQFDETRTRRFGGVGLGLAIAQRLAQLMDGELDFVSQPGEGSTFWIDLPAPGCGDVEPPEEGATGWLEGLRILVVEDNPTNQLVATAMLRQLGAEVATADNGAQGVEAASHEAFDVILMDIQMPIMDGMEATRRIRALPPPLCDVPIVALTANVLGPQLQAYGEAGMNGCVAKPFSPATLLAELSRLANFDEATPDERASVGAQVSGFGG